MIPRRLPDCVWPSISTPWGFVPRRMWGYAGPRYAELVYWRSFVSTDRWEFA